MNKELFSKNISTLRECSYDSANNEPMTESTCDVINFDKVCEEYFKLFKAKPLKSVDALIKRLPN